MHRQAQIERQAQRERRPDASPAAGSGFRQVMADVLELAELQARLLAVDGQEAGRRSAKAGAAAAVALVLLLAATTTALTGLGYVLYEQLEWSIGVSLLVVAAVAVAMSGIAGAVAYVMLRRAAGSMKESTSELSENLKWVREVLTRPDSPRNRIRADSFPEAPWQPPDRF